jgi:hypothetical protein
MGRMYKSCEFCFELMPATPHHTVCGVCDLKMKREYEAADAAREASRPKRACRTCGTGLPATRYFQCEYCMPEDTRESADDVWDAADDMDAESVACTGTKQRVRLTHAEKKCTTCKKTHPIAMYSKEKKSRDGHYSKCKPCQAVAWAAYKAKKEAAKYGLQQV